MVRAVVLSVISFGFLLTGTAQAAMVQYCGYPFISSHTFETTQGRGSKEVIVSVDLSSQQDIESLLEKDGLCTCFSGEISRVTPSNSATLRSINIYSIAAVGPSNSSCQFVKNNSTIEEFRD